MGGGREVMAMRRPLFAIAVGTLLAALAACEPNARWNAPGEGDRPPEIHLTSPVDGATGVPTSAEIVFTAVGTREVEVRLADAAGGNVDGVMRADGSSWLAAVQLKYETTYTATVIATSTSGTKAEAKSRFTTMTQPADLVDVHSWIGDDQVVGVGMPVVVTFGLDVSQDRRDDVQRRLFVRSDPPQEGIWNWFNPHEVHYRPREHWRPGTKLDIRIGTGGLPWGLGQWHGRHDLTVRASVGPALLIEVDNKTKTMKVTRDGKVLRTIPVSLGKPSSPSSYGNLLVMVRKPWEFFDSSTYGVPVNSPDGYRTRVEWTMRLTWGGEYIHAAPWSVADQGRRNVSHGCVNITTASARWLYGIVKVGDPVTVRGTERRVTWGDGWTDWDRPWSEYVKGSAVAPSATAPATSSPGN
jgi:lipoprotein-anchoring transpeptidase ErfK/SrfK